MGPLRIASPALAFLAATLTLTVALRASAQQSEPAPSPPPSAAADTTVATDSLSTALAAEEPRYHLRPVVVTGERTPLPLDRVPLDVTVIDE